MNQLLESKRPGRTAGTGPATVTVAAFVAGLIVTVLGVGYAVLDQLALHGLDGHLHALYDSIGKYAQPAPLYGYLYAVGGLGIVCWLVSLGFVRSGARPARVWSVVVLVLAALTIAPLFLREYGQAVFLFRLSGWFVGAWLFGLIGTVAQLRRPANR